MEHDTPFVHLHLHSAYSLAEGALRVKELVSLCQKQNMPAVAVTDTNNLFGALEFAIAATKSGVQPIIGCQVNVGVEGHQLVLLVQSQEGYTNLSKIVSDAYMEGDPATTFYTEWDNIEENAEGLICLTGATKGPVNQYLLHNQNKDAEKVLKKLKGMFKGRLYVELQRHNLPEEERVEEALLDLAYKHDVPLVATNDCYFAAREMHEAHDALLCIAEGRYVTEDDRRKVTPEHYFKSAAEMTKLFADIPEAIINTGIIAQRCHFLLKPIDPILPPFETEGGRTEEEELIAQSTEGLQWRLDNFIFTPDMDEEKRKEIAKPYFERLDYELDVIKEMGFPGYFLIVSDFIQWAKDQNIPVGPGRGSGAGSVVAWALKITDLDPLEHQLLFERFLNPERVSMPDFDVDFCRDRRDEVIQYVQRKYGYDKVAQIITFGKLQARAVVRDVGRVLQMPYGQVDRIAKMIPANPISLEEALEQDADLRAERYKDDTTDKLITIALQLEGLFRHASTHAAGVVIGDRPLYQLTPLYRDPSSEMPVTQFNMKYVEQAGLVKFDFLGLKTMTVIQKTVDIIKETKGKDIDILQVPLDDDTTFEMLRRGYNTGVFQMESAGMRDLGRQMKISNFEQIIALVALYRPGPMENIPKYLACLHGKEERDFMHPKLKPFLEDTYGVMIYQEQVMQAAQVLAGYTLGGADLLRRAMGKKIKEEMDKQREIFVQGAKEHNDVSSEKANEIFDQINKFAGYGFNKAHSAGYALVAYWTAYLKANYPVEFMAASMTLDMQVTDKLAIFKQELDRMGIQLLPPDINHSNPDFKVEGDAVRYALAALKGVGEQAMHNLVAEREDKGAYKDFMDLANRIDVSGLNKRQFEQLACAGAFDVFNENRAQVYAGAETVLRHAQSMAQDREAGQVSLFGGGDDSSAALENKIVLPDAEPWDHMEKLRYEYEAIGFYLSAHPLDPKAQLLDQRDVISCANIANSKDRFSGGMCKMAGVLLKKQIKVSPRTGKKYAFLQLSDSTGVYEAMMFTELLMRVKDKLETGAPFLLKVIPDIKDEEQIRYTIQDISPLEEALEAEIADVTFFMKSEQPVSQLKDLLDQEGHGNVKIRLVIDLDQDNRADVILPGQWRLSAEAKKALMKNEGVLEIQEA